METTIKISPKELTPTWLKKIKALFEDEDSLEITIKPVQDSLFSLNESKEEYISRINSAISNLESNTDTVTISKDDYQNLIN